MLRAATLMSLCPLMASGRWCRCNVVSFRAGGSKLLKEMKLATFNGLVQAATLTYCPARRPLRMAAHPLEKRSRIPGISPAR